jgi:protein SCO1/2
MSQRRLHQQVWFAAALAAACALAALTGCDAGPRTVGTFELKDADGRAFTASRFAGQWSFLVFGYTSCPDVCPITLAELAKVYQLLKQRLDAPRNVQVVFVSVDPARDAPEDLKGFTRFFDRDIIAATGPIPELNRLTDSLGAFHRRLTEQGEDYRVEHSADVWLIDPELHLRARYAAPIKADRVVAEFLNLFSKGVSSS